MQLRKNGKTLAEAFPEIAAEWHPEKNGELTPTMISAGSEKMVWWTCSLKKHEWIEVISNRSKKFSRKYNLSCPICNSLQERFPDVAKEWHWELNEKMNPELKPDKISFSSNYKIWWKCLKNPEHIWPAAINDRTKLSKKTGNTMGGCPYCSNRKVDRENSISKTHTDIVKEWNYEKNGNLKPEMFSKGSRKIVWWKCFKHGHEWKTAIYDRTRGRGCAKCNSLASMNELRILAELESIFDKVEHRARVNGKECDIFIKPLNLAIEYDGAHWHRDQDGNDRRKNESLKAKDVDVIRVREKGLPKINETDLIVDNRKFCVHDIQQVLKVVIQKCSLQEMEIEKVRSYLELKSFAADDRYKELLGLYPFPHKGQSLADSDPQIASQWHPTKNGNLTPFDVGSWSNKTAWWICSKGHEWEERIHNRSRVKGTFYGDCKRCKSIKELYPDLAAEWNFVKNGELTPQDVTIGSEKNVWWKCRVCGNEWKAKVGNRVKGIVENKRESSGAGCLQCRHLLEKRFPEVFKMLHPTKNVTKLSELKVSRQSAVWICKMGHEFKKTITRMIVNPSCPHCVSLEKKSKLLRDYNRGLKLKPNFPEKK